MGRYNAGMATLTHTDLTRVGALSDLPMPLTLRPAVAMSDEEIIAFSHRNKPYRIERNPQGELVVGFRLTTRKLWDK